MLHLWMSHVAYKNESCSVYMNMSLQCHIIVGAYTNESCGIIWSHIIVGAYTNESCSVYMNQSRCGYISLQCHIIWSHIIVGAYTNESCSVYVNQSRCGYISLQCHIIWSHIIVGVYKNMTSHNMTLQPYESVTLSIWMSHVTRVNELCHTCEWVILYV